MSHTTNRESLVHCNVCGEEYSPTYKRCPFCGKKPNSWSTDSIPKITEDYEDEYIFEGGALFDEPTPPTAVRNKGGKRLATPQKRINWPRLITVFCAFVILASAVVIATTLLRSRTPNTPAPEVSHPVADSPTPSHTVNVEFFDSTTEETEAPGESETTTPDPEEAPSSPAPVVATDITFSNTEFTLAANESHTIRATVSPEDWTGTITWSSSNDQIATVDQNGTVTNVNKADQILSATITATTSDGLSVKTKVYCRGGSASGLTLNKTDFTLTLGKDSTFTMKVTSGDTDVTWYSSDTTVATIDENGKVTAVGPGTATITATASDGSTSKCIVRVRAS